MADKDVIEGNLPDDVIGKIVAMIPFPYVLKARTLSKSWSSAFSANPDSHCFQTEVKSIDTEWETYGPVYISNNHWLRGYDHVLRRWQNMFSLSYFPPHKNIWTFIRHASSLSGSLLCGVLDAQCFSTHETFSEADIFVTNVITKGWKKLPARPDMVRPDQIHISASRHGTYKVVVLTHPDPPDMEDSLFRLITLQVYDSIQNTWTFVENKVCNSSVIYYQDAVYSKSNNRFYVLYRDWILSLRTQIAAFDLMEYQLESGCCSRITLVVPPIRHIDDSFVSGLVECGDDLMVVLMTDPMRYTDAFDSDEEPYIPCDPKWKLIGKFLPSRLPSCSVVILKVDLEKRELIPFARGPPTTIVHAYCDQFVSDKDCIYLLSACTQSPVVVFNVREREWSHLPPAFGTYHCGSATDGKFFPFQPGLGPFMAV